MEDQGKRILLAVGLALALMMVWQYFFPPEVPVKKEVAEEVAPDDSKTAEGDSPEITPPKERIPEQEIVIVRPLTEVTFSTIGAGIKSWRLLDPRYVNQRTEEPLNMNPVPEMFGRGLRIGFPGSTIDIPADASWALASQGEDEIVFEWADEALSVRKVFTFGEVNYTLKLQVTVESKSDKELRQSLAVFLTGRQDPDDGGGGGIGRVPRVWAANCYASEKRIDATVSDLEEDGAISGLGASWAGLVHSYFLSVVAVIGDDGNTDRIRCGGWLERDDADAREGIIQTTLKFPSVRMKKGDIFERSLLSYMGPKYLDKLEELSGSSAGFARNPHLEKSLDLGWLGMIARPLLGLLKWFYGFVGNWGVAIILLTLTVKLATIYWTHKSMVSMQEMAKLRPELDKLKEKYPDDQEKQRLETMNLFKANNVNPMASCLPMLLQMPIWFALYRTLTVAAELYRAPFVHGWVDDLTAPDPYYILPIAVTLVMFLQSQLTPQTASGPQQKIMQYGMPLMFGVFSFFFPAGLTLYILTNTLLSATHHLYMHKIRKKDQGGNKGPSPRNETKDKNVGQVKSSSSSVKKEASTNSGSKKTNQQGQRKKKRKNKKS